MGFINYCNGLISGKLNLNDVKKKWGVENVFRTIVLVCDWLNRDENVQVNGLRVFLDNTDVTMGHFLTVMSGENGKGTMQFYQVRVIYLFIT